MNELLNLIVTILLLGIGMGIINKFIPMPGAIKSVLNLAVLVIVILYVLQYFAWVDVSLPLATVFK